MNMFRSLVAELIKIKRTSIIYLSFLIAAIMPLFSLFEYLMERELDPENLDSWISFFSEAQQGISLILLPLFTVLICTLLPQIEFKNNTWKQVHATPQPFIYVFLSKFLIIQLFLVLFLTSNMILMILSGAVANLYHPDLPFLNSAIPFLYILKINAITYVSVLGISAFQFWVGMRFKNIITPITLGLGLWFFGCLLVFEFHWQDADLFPYSYYLLSAFPKFKDMLPFILWSSTGYCLIILLFSFFNLKMKKPNS